MSSVSFEFACVHSGATRGRRVHSTFAWIHSGTPRDRGVDPVSCGLTRACLGFLVRFSRVRVDSLRRA